MAEALKQVKQDMGSDAVILHTRTYHRRAWLGLRRQEVVEITAGKGLQTLGRGNGHKSARRTEALPRLAPRQEVAVASVRSDGASITYGPGAVRRSALPPPEAMIAPVDPRKALLETPAANTAVMLGLTEDVASLKNMVRDLVKSTRVHQAPTVPEEVMDYYLTLIQNQVAEELAGDLVRTLKATVRPELLQNPEIIRERLAEQLEKMLPVSGPIIRTKKVGPHVVALIGPTGVGKTTTVAKLAANLKLREGRRVGLITIDTFRIAAVDQLKKYADIIGSPLKVVNTPEDLREAIAAMHDCEFVLIDTAGRSPTDALKLNELKSFLAAAQPDEVHLVLSTTASQSCIESAVARFGEVGMDKMIFTKLDEAVHVGTVLNVIRKVNKSLSYVTTGQDVPDDIEVGHARRLAQLILGNAPAPVAPLRNLQNSQSSTAALAAGAGRSA